MGVATTKALISCAVTAQLICAFVFAKAKIWFSHNAAQMVSAAVYITDFMVGNMVMQHAFYFMCLADKKICQPDLASFPIL